MSLSDQVAELEDALEEAERLGTEAQTRIAELEDELAGAVFNEDVLELIADHKRGLVSTEELYERTIGR